MLGIFLSAGESESTIFGTYPEDKDFDFLSEENKENQHSTRYTRASTQAATDTSHDTPPLNFEALSSLLQEAVVSDAQAPLEVVEDQATIENESETAASPLQLTEFIDA
jgi:hypothetical protein